MEYLTIGEFFIKYQEWILLATAVLAFLAAAANQIFTAKQTKSTDLLVNTSKDVLAAEHQTLMELNRDLKAGQNNTFTQLKEGQLSSFTQLKEKLTTVEGIATKLHEENLLRKGQNEALAKQGLDITKTMEHITAMAARAAELSTENAQLKAQLLAKSEALDTAQNQIAALEQAYTQLEKSTLSKQNENDDWER